MTGIFGGEEVDSITTAGTQKLYLDTMDAALMKGKRILIVDDVISTGNSLTAIENLVKSAGGIVAGNMAILAEGDAIGRKDIVYLEKLPLFEPDGTPIW
jgi:adenine phosphoribosyltransferase